MPSRLLWEHFEFLSTPSARRATGFGAQTPSGGYDFYPRPPRGGRQDSETNGFRIIKFLSTPSARRATRTRRQMVSGSSNFYPRPPRGGRLVEFCQLHQPVVFLSTPSARRATRNSYMFTRFLRDFYPRPPRGGRPEGVTREYFVHIISIHALREEGDMRTVYRVQTAQTFLSTPSARRATRHLFQALHCTR